MPPEFSEIRLISRPAAEIVNVLKPLRHCEVLSALSSDLIFVVPVFCGVVSAYRLYSENQGLRELLDAGHERQVASMVPGRLAAVQLLKIVHCSCATTAVPPKTLVEFLDWKQLRRQLCSQEQPGDETVSIRNRLVQLYPERNLSRRLTHERSEGGRISGREKRPE